MRLKDIGETSLIKRLLERFTHKDPRVLKAIGDDAAVTRIDDKRCLLSTIDTLVEGIHFSKIYTSPKLLGRKSVSISLSDIAAMGGTPLFFLVSIALPSETGQDFFEEFYEGVKDCADAFGVFLVGGNTSASHSGVVITTAMLGEAQKDEVVYRSGAKTGDIIYVTGTLGDSALGLMALKKKGAPGEKNGAFKNAVARHLNPQPRVSVGRLISRKKLATSMIDISDGLLVDLRHIAVESKKGAAVELEKLPLSNEVKDYVNRHPAAWELPLSGGEDYELLFTSPKEKAKDIFKVAKNTGVGITPIGKILPPGKGISVVKEDGASVPVKKEGYEHFMGNPASIDRSR
ncbi:MAG TPA: thiamine-phosphate kinase [Thermodesulfobacteriota bacterium]|nr:thiamine-phosphate kinase [Thermodesulfobacteriota bacterium]